MKSFSPVKAFTWKGKLQVALIKALLFLVSLVQRNKWKFPEKGFEENPRYFTLHDVAYLSYKYFYSQLVHGDKNSRIEEYFQSRDLQSSESDSGITISLGGDLMAYSCVNSKTCAALWNACGDFFFSSDIVFANLETPVDLSKEPGLAPEVMINDMLFNANDEIFSIFNGNKKFKGFDVLSVANNHSLDQGKDGLLSTMNFLKGKDIRYSGGSVSKKEVNDFPIIAKNGISVAFISFTFSLNKFDLSTEDEWICNHIRLNKEGVDISRIIEQASIARMRGADIVIASLHMGNAYQAYPSMHIINTIHRICREAHIDVVVAGHPHNPQPVEWLEYSDHTSLKRKSLILYSLGDFVGYDIYSWAHLSLLVKLNITRSATGAVVSGFKILPAYMLAEIEGQKITTLNLVHLEDAYRDKETFQVSIQKDLESAFQLFNLLFTIKQRNSIVVKSIAK